MYEISQTFMFDAAHTLKRHVPVDEYESSQRIHGHTYTVEVTMRGDKLVNGFISIPTGTKKFPNACLDLFWIREEIAKVKSLLDHRLLDEVEGLSFPTMECIAQFVAERMNVSACRVSVSRQTGDKATFIKP